MKFRHHHPASSVFVVLITGRYYLGWADASPPVGLGLLASLILLRLSKARASSALHSALVELGSFASRQKNRKKKKPPQPLAGNEKVLYLCSEFEPEKVFTSPAWAELYLPFSFFQKAVKTIQDSLNEDLPLSYDREVFSAKTNLLMNHFIDMAVQGYGWVAA